MDPEDRATTASASRPDQLEDARIDVLDRLVAEQKPLADGESVHDHVQPAWIASRRLRLRYCNVGVIADPMS
jgi:hypothetical protein